MAGAFVATLACVVACGGPAKEGGAGADCFRATECQAGLVCIDHKCTSDLTSIDIPAEGGPGAGGSGSGMGGGAAGSTGGSGPGGAGGASAGSTGSGGPGGQGTSDASAE